MLIMNFTNHFFLKLNRMASKKDREIIFNKYGGCCAYCGDELQKGWHVDELLPVRRKWRFTEAGFIHKITGEVKPDEVNGWKDPDYEYRPSKKVADGMEHPERLHIDNQMPSCPSCNINKHSSSLEGFRSLIEGFINSLNRDSTQYNVAKRYGLISETKKPVIFYFEQCEPINNL